jgi:hypothetical protein
MKQILTALVGISLVSSPAFGQVRPQDCRPVLPVMDDVAAVPADVVAEPVTPVAAARRGFFGLPFLLPLLAAVGGIAAIASSGGGNNNPVSPA